MRRSRRWLRSNDLFDAAAKERHRSETVSPTRSAMQVDPIGHRIQISGSQYGPVILIIRLGPDEQSVIGIGKYFDRNVLVSHLRQPFSVISRRLCYWGKGV